LKLPDSANVDAHYYQLQQVTDTDAKETTKKSQKKKTLIRKIYMGVRDAPLRNETFANAGLKGTIPDL